VSSKERNRNHEIINMNKSNTQRKPINHNYLCGESMVGGKMPEPFRVVISKNLPMERIHFQTSGFRAPRCSCY
jgi:hypothetical protein